MSGPGPASPLRVGLVAVARDAFKGDAEAITERARAALEVDAEGLGYDVVTPDGLVRDVPDAVRAAGWATEHELDYLLILLATFTTGEVVAPLLQTASHVGMWAVPEAEGIPRRRPGTRADADPLPLNSLCGLTMAMSLLEHPRVGRDGPVKWFWGPPGDATVRRRWGVTVRALRGARALAGASVLQVGGTAPGFYRLEELPGVQGARVTTAPLEALFDRMARLRDAEVDARAAAWAREEPLDDATPEQLAVAARTELALAALASEGAHHAVALRCWPEFPERCGAMACAAVGRLADRRLPTACEGDVMGALSMLALQAVADAPAALMDLSDLDPDGDRVLLWHCGNAPAAFAARSGTRLATHFNRDGVGAVRDMVLAPGPATGWRLLAGGREAVIVGGRLGDPDAASFDGVRGWWHDLSWDGAPRSATELVAQLLDERLPHHLALAPGDHVEALHELSVLLGARVLPARRVRDALQEAPVARPGTPPPPPGRTRRA